MSKFFYAIVLAMVIMSCGKDIDLFIPRANQDTGNISRLISRLQNDLGPNYAHVLQVPCNGDKSFSVDKDVVISIPPGFVDLDLYPCTKGYFEVYVKICDSKGEMLLSGIPTLSQGKLIESRIEIQLTILDGTNDLPLADGKTITVRVNDPDPREKMELFYSNASATEWWEADGDPEAWDNVKNTVWTLIDYQHVITGAGYELESNVANWLNIAAYYALPPDQFTDVCIELPAGFDTKNTSVFMVMDDFNSVLPMYGNADVLKFCEPYGSVPVGAKVTFIVLAELREGNYLFDMLRTTVTAHQIEVLSPVNTPYEEIKNFISFL